jgi:type II secretory pathway pseudopilin PulG
MKFLLVPRRRRLAFTLVELLVVIGIIAILAGVLVASVGAAIAFAKRTKANTTATQIATAVQNYYTEYGVYPTADAAGSAAGDDYYQGTAEGNWPALMYALCGNQNPASPTSTAGASGTVPNTRDISYLSPTHGDVNADGVFLNPFDTGSSAAPTAPAANNAPYFYMAVDTDYSGIVGDSGAAASKLPDFSKYPTNYTGAVLANGTPGGVAVWSPCDQTLSGGTTGKASPATHWAHTY